MATMRLRAVGATVLAVLALVGTLCVLDGSTQIREGKQPAPLTLNGDKLLQSQKAELDAERERAGKGKNLKAVDDMVRGFTSNSFTKEEGNAFTESLKAAGPKKDDLAVALSPQALGLVSKSGFAPGLNLLQGYVPSGQEGLAAQIAKAKVDDAEAEAGANGLKGHGLLSAAGVVKDEEEKGAWDGLDLGLLQTKSDEYVVKGQGGLASQIASAKDDDEQANIKADGLKGNGLLSAAGVAEDTMLLQLPQDDWTPKGQPGLNNAIASAKIVDEEDEAQRGGLKGHGLLSAAGVTKDDADSLELNFVQELKPYRPAGASSLSSPQRYDAEETKKPALPDIADPIHGASILAAADMGGHMKPKDELAALGSVDDLDLDLN